MTIPRLQKRMNVPSHTSLRGWTATDGGAKVGSRRRGRGGTRALLWHQRPPTKEGTGPSPTEAGRTVVSTDGVAGGFGAVDPAAGAALGAAGPRVARQCRAPNVNRRTGRDQSLAGRAPAEGSRLGSCFAAKGKNRLLPALLLALTLWLAAADPADAHLGHEVGARFAVATPNGSTLSVAAPEAFWPVMMGRSNRGVFDALAPEARARVKHCSKRLPVGAFAFCRKTNFKSFIAAS